METMIAYCGIVCTNCEAYVATQSNDMAALERQAARARTELGVPTATAEGVMCDGCLSNSSRKCGYCTECAVRACGVARGIANCASCPEYACEKLTGFFAMAPQARITLDSLRGGLTA